MAVSFRCATLCLWAAALRVGSILGFVPVRWCGGLRGRALPKSLAAVLASFASCFILHVATFAAAEGAFPVSLVVFLAIRLSCEYLAYGTRPKQLALLLNCVKQYLAVHPLGRRHWRALFLGTAVMLVYFAVWETLFARAIAISHDTGVVGVTSAFAAAALHAVGVAVLHWRLNCPMSLLGAAAADLRVECTRKLQADCGARRPLDSHAWRALRQRQFLLHDMVREASRANGPCFLHLMVCTFLVSTPSLGAPFNSFEEDSFWMLLLHGITLFNAVLIMAVCPRPAVEFQAMANELQALMKDHRYSTVEFGIKSELQQLLTSVEELQENRFDVMGIFYSDTKTATDILSSVCMVLFSFMIKLLF